MDAYHIPVMLIETLEALRIDPDGVYIDTTFGAGGHSKAILKKLSAKGRLYGFDQDEDAVSNALDDHRFTLVQANFRYVQKYMRVYGVEKVDGVLMDLGVSSHQFDLAERGFSYRFDAELDMRMNQNSIMTAQKILNSYSAENLQQIFSAFGEVRNARSLARKIVEEREAHEFRTTVQLNSFLNKNRIGDFQKYQSQVYQALRIEVNDEIGALKSALDGVGEILKPGGRLVVMSYHSIEDRIVKNYIKTGNSEGLLEKDDYGKILKTLKSVNKKIILASDEEIRKNSRAKSAKMRIAEKVK
jgi:16S rRNA (cytosine1402-N4)-methyltransferase